MKRLTKSPRRPQTETPAQPLLFRHIWRPHFHEAEQQNASIPGWVGGNVPRRLGKYHQERENGQNRHWLPFKMFRNVRDRLTRALGSLLAQIWSGRIPHPRRITGQETQACIGKRWSTPVKETVTHFLFDCSDLRPSRSQRIQMGELAVRENKYRWHQGVHRFVESEPAGTRSAICDYKASDERFLRERKSHTRIQSHNSKSSLHCESRVLLWSPCSLRDAPFDPGCRE